MFITLEGGEGTGKSTQARLLAERLRAAGYTVHLTREPGGTPLADAIRALLMHPGESRAALAAAGLVPPAEELAEPPDAPLPMTDVLLFSAARAQHVARIRAWLASGAIVVSDRYADATRAYQGAAGGVEAADVAAAERLATGGLMPNLTVLLDLGVEEGQRRRAQAHAAGGEWNRLDAADRAFHERVRQGYLALAAAEPQRFVTLDAALPLDALAVRIWEVVSPRLPPS